MCTVDGAELSAVMPLPQKAGASRLTTIASISDSGAAAAIQGDAVAKLLQVLDASPDAGAQCVAAAVLSCIPCPGSPRCCRLKGYIESASLL